MRYCNASPPQMTQRRRTFTAGSRVCWASKEKNDLKLLMGEGTLTQREASITTGYEHVMGTHEPRRMNENGELLPDFCTFSNMDIVGSSLTKASTRPPGGPLTVSQTIRSSNRHLGMATLRLRLKQCLFQKNPRF